MHGWRNHTIEMKSKKKAIEIEIALIDKKREDLASHSHERLYTSEGNRRRGWMTNIKKRGND